MSLAPRSPFVRAILEKYDHMQKHKGSRHDYWYEVDETHLSSELIKMFRQFNQDAETDEFLNECYEKSDWLFTSMYQMVAKSLLTWVMSATSANGLLNRGSMFVLSTAQFHSLLAIDSTAKLCSLLDLGAGDGVVTDKLRHNFRETFVTEASSIMRWRLGHRNYTVLEIENWDDASNPAVRSLLDQSGRVKYDVVSCLNLLDRCDRPVSLLKRIRAVLNPETGRLLVALVFPLKQYVEYSRDNRPSEVIDVPSSHLWEVQFSDVLDSLFTPLGFQLVSWSRVPYLCQGDCFKSFYHLNDIVMVFKPTPVD